MIRRKAEQLIFVDGKVYRETAEPMYVVKSGHFEHRIGAEITDLDRIEGPRTSPSISGRPAAGGLEAIAARFGRRELQFDAERPATFKAYVPDWIEVRVGFEHVLTYRHDQTPQFLAAVDRAVPRSASIWPISRSPSFWPTANCGTRTGPSRTRRASPTSPAGCATRSATRSSTRDSSGGT